MKIFKKLLYYGVAFCVMYICLAINGLSLGILWDRTSIIFISAGYIFCLNHFSLRDLALLFQSDVTEDNQKAQYILNTFSNYGFYASGLAFLLGLVHAMGNLSETKVLGAAVALALLPLLYALAMKIFVFMPWANQLESKNLPYKVHL